MKWVKKQKNHGWIYLDFIQYSEKECQTHCIVEAQCVLLYAAYFGVFLLNREHC